VSAEADLRKDENFKAVHSAPQFGKERTDRAGLYGFFNLGKQQDLFECFALVSALLWILAGKNRSKPCHATGNRMHLCCTRFLIFLLLQRRFVHILMA
jgi:hypothetical protein